MFANNGKLKIWKKKKINGTAAHSKQNGRHAACNERCNCTIFDTWHVKRLCCLDSKREICIFEQNLFILFPKALSYAIILVYIVVRLHNISQLHPNSKQDSTKKFFAKKKKSLPRQKEKNFFLCWILLPIDYRPAVLYTEIASQKCLWACICAFGRKSQRVLSRI